MVGREGGDGRRSHAPTAPMTRRRGAVSLSVISSETPLELATKPGGFRVAWPANQRCSGRRTGVNFSRIDSEQNGNVARARRQWCSSRAAF